MPKGSQSSRDSRGGKKRTASDTERSGTSSRGSRRPAQSQKRPTRNESADVASRFAGAPDVVGSGGSSNEDDSDALPSIRPPAQVVAALPTTHPGDRWNAMDETRLSLNRDERTVEVYVKDIFFRRCKFIRDKTEMEFDVSAASICQTVCRGCNIADAQQREWWRFANRKIDKYLNKKRSDSNATLKRKFIGKSPSVV